MKDNISQLGDYDAPFYEQQLGLVISFVQIQIIWSFDQLIPLNCLKF